MPENLDILAPSRTGPAECRAYVPAVRHQFAGSTLDLIRNAAGKIQNYESAFAWMSREVGATVARLKAENIDLRARVADLEARLLEAETVGRSALTALHASHVQCVDLHRQVRDMEAGLRTAEEHLGRSTSYISRLAAFILRTHVVQDVEPGFSPASSANDVHGRSLLRATG